MKIFKISSPSEIIRTEHVPNIKLCRYFKKQKYADSFNNGEYRFGNLKQYRKPQFKLDPRSNPTESECYNYQTDGSVFGSFSTGNYYTLCFTELNKHTEEYELAKKFGNSEIPAIQIIIRDNISLTKRILNAWSKSKYKNRIAYFQWHKVVYNKNEVGNFKPLEDNQDLHVYQKPKRHETLQLKRIKISPVSSRCIDLGGEIGTIKEFSSLNFFEMNEYNRLVDTNDWQKIDSNVNDFEMEQEWRLVFVSEAGFNISTGEPFKAIEKEYFILSYSIEKLI